MRLLGEMINSVLVRQVKKINVLTSNYYYSKLIQLLSFPSISSAAPRQLFQLMFFIFFFCFFFFFFFFFFTSISRPTTTRVNNYFARFKSSRRRRSCFSFAAAAALFLSFCPLQ
jgi:hypothetical protein